MSKLVSGIILATCVSQVAWSCAPPPLKPTSEELLPPAVRKDAPQSPSVSVECCGRIRHGVMAIGGETTGTTITFNRMTWELQLNNDSARKFVTNHHKKHVTVTGSLRKVAGIEGKERWIVDVAKASELDATNPDPNSTTSKTNTKNSKPTNPRDREHAQLTIRGTLQAKDPRAGQSSGMTIHANGLTWPIAITKESKLQEKATSLVGQTVVLTGMLEPVGKKNSSKPSVSQSPVILVKTLKHSDDKATGRSEIKKK